MVLDTSQVCLQSHGFILSYGVYGFEFNELMNVNVMMKAWSHAKGLSGSAYITL